MTGMCDSDQLEQLRDRPASTLEPAATRLLALAAHVCAADAAQLWLLDPRLGWWCAGAQQPTELAPSWQVPALWADQIASCDLLILSELDAPADPGVPGFLACGALHGPDGALFGALCVLGAAPRQLTSGQERALRDVLGLACMLLPTTELPAPPPSLDLAALVRADPDMVLLLDAVGLVRYASPALGTTLGWQPSSWLGRSIGELLHPADADTLMSRLAALAPGAQSSLYLRASAANGDWHALIGQASNLLDQPEIAGVLLRLHEADEHETAEHRLRGLFDQAPIGVLAINPAGQIVLLNQAICELFGYSQAELLGQPVELIIPETPRRRHSELREAFFNGPYVRSNSEVLDLYGTTRDGQSFPIDVRLARLDRHHESLALAFITDMSRQRRAEALLRESEERYRSLIDLVPDGVSVVRGDRILFSNAAHARILGAERPEEILGHSVKEFVRDIQQPVAMERIGILGSGQNLTPLVYKLTRVDGKVAQFETISTGISYDGEPAVISISRDVTGRYEAEERMRLLESVVEYANDAVIVTDAQPIDPPGPRIRYVNPAFTRITGYSAEEVLGKTPRLFQGPKTDRSATAQIRAALQVGASIRRELINYRSDGQEIWIDLSIAPIVDRDGLVTHYIAIQRDISDRKRLEEQVLHAQKMESIGRLAGGVAHDFNNLLTAIGGYADMALENLPSHSTVRLDIAEIRQSVDRAAALARQLLVFARKQTIAPQVLDLNQLILGIDKLIRRLLGEDIDLRIVTPPDQLRILADPGQIEQVLVNLAVNARDAMPDGGELVITTALVALDRVDNPAGPPISAAHARILVRDTGCGMPPEVLQHAFDPFFTTKDVMQGTGLGLSTSYGIITQHGGMITLESTVGQGTLVTIDLPLATQSYSAPVISVAQVNERVHGHETVLVVEDDVSVRALVLRVLRNHGYTVLEASNGFEALQLLERYPPHTVQLVLTDMVMPDLGGRGLANVISERSINVRVLFMSGYAERAMTDFGDSSLRIGFVQKPFTSAILVRAVRDLLDA